MAMVKCNSNLSNSNNMASTTVVGLAMISTTCNNSSKTPQTFMETMLVAMEWEPAANPFLLIIEAT